jgi:hypothetical protein
MEPADLWAIANLKHKQLPPIEFDHPTKRRTHIIEIDNEAELRKRCGWPADPYGGIMVGCTKVYNLEPYADGGCEIFVGPPQTARTGVTRNLIIRHEMGHCNGITQEMMERREKEARDYAAHLGYRIRRYRGQLVLFSRIGPPEGGGLLSNLDGGPSCNRKTQ